MELPGHLSQLLRSWKSEFGSNTLFSRGVAGFPAPNRLECNYLVYLKSRPFKIALNLSLCTLSYHLSLSVECGLDLMQPHHNTRLQLSSLFTLLSINLNSLVCFSLYYVSGNIDLFFYLAADPNLAVH